MSDKPTPKASIYAERELAILEQWRERSTFARLQASRLQANAAPFIFFEGPPTTNAKPALHHVLGRVIKDIICRYQTMRGHYVPRQSGYDTHGLPVELMVEKELGLTNKSAVEAYGIAKFNQRCREIVWQNKADWDSLTERIGYWIEGENPYITYDNDYIESVWWAISQIQAKGALYRDFKILPFCTRCGTGLSLAEVAQGYQDIQSRTAVVKFRLMDQPASVLAWTTTPWTLLGNVALAVNPELTYCLVEQNDERFYLADSCLKILVGEYLVIKTVPGSLLVGLEYLPLFETPNLVKLTGKQAYRILAAEWVTAEDGTGVVHTAVMYGEDDFNLGQAHDLPLHHTVDETGHFTADCGQFAGLSVVEAVEPILSQLQSRGQLYREISYKHSYPHCWRCQTALLYYARESWFIRIDDQLRQRLVELNQEIVWEPAHIRDGRFGKWLSGLRDWAISRNRYWGTPLPIWVCDLNPEHYQVISSIDELVDRSGQARPDDLHRPFIDEYHLPCDRPGCTGRSSRVSEVLDVWFDSGAMPFAAKHYPFANQALFESQAVADFISEGVDQTRGWFNTLHIISTLLFDRPAYRSVICLNHLLDQHGHKMSKSKGNIVDPVALIEQHGVDAVRFYFSSVNRPGENKTFAEPAVAEVNRKVINLWHNVWQYYQTYQGIASEFLKPVLPRDQWLDGWLKAYLKQQELTICQALDRLDILTASRAVASTIETISTVYLQLSRARRDSELLPSLAHALKQSAILAAPFLPFNSEIIYQAITGTDDSVHTMLLQPEPLTETEQGYLVLMVQIEEALSEGLRQRVEAKRKVRQPLAKFTIQWPANFRNLTGSERAALTELVASRLNCLTVELVASANESPNYILDTTLTPELEQLGLERELIRTVQEWRKALGAEPGQTIAVELALTSSLANSLTAEQWQHIASLTHLTIDQQIVEAADLANDPLAFNVNQERISLTQK
ncbi:MAG: isoleucyl-tRNA synthetase [Candidatus Berkelbacteria bacterium Gr01-1014_85]|uniref:Isoleucine--tRNA ligase n=1 Tax=Candidatus Berkelbacteria bacterium Gr01-1014_85 TaxID=2017150 RepID=A0A554JC62_9BACT|nr:MAG: isoleucyl-tRNA synthetase [Candidatus Berkelbacteria bacterium Gr01-1014_85]